MVACGCLLIIGCARPQPLYYWGNYEDLIYQTYKEPGAADTTTLITQLIDDINQANSEGKHTPPGLHVQLGYLYFLQNNTQAGLLEFRTEKQLFPESTIFVDGMMGRLKK